jgi:hypothetical protein
MIYYMLRVPRTQEVSSCVLTWRAAIRAGRPPVPRAAAGVTPWRVYVQFSSFG